MSAMTISEIAHDDQCVNCNADTRDDDGARDVAGWGMMCSFCYEGMLDVQAEAQQAYADPYGW